MKTIFSDRIYIYNPTAEVVLWCQDNLIIANPKYEQLKKLHKDAEIARYHIPPKMSLYAESSFDLILPFGCFRGVWPLVKNYPYEARFEKVQELRNKYEQITQPLYDYQDEAVSAMVKASNGVLIGGCGSGKTNCGIEIIHRIGKNALWLCHTHDLLIQTKKRILSLYPNMNVGTITDGKINMVKDGITISTIQTLVNVDPDIYSDSFATVVTDECFPAGTKINTPNGYKNIEDIKIGDEVLSFNHLTNKVETKKVTELFVKRSNNLYRLKSIDGKEIVATGNHPFFTQRGYVSMACIRPGESIKKIIFKELPVWVEVDSVESVCAESKHKSVVYNFGVEDNHNYFVDDILVHNCHHISGSPTLQKSFVKVLNKISAPHKYGLTASKNRNDCLTKSIYATVGFNLEGKAAPTWEISREDANTLTATHERVSLDTPFDYCILNDDGTFNFNNLVDYIAFNEKRNEFISNKIVELSKDSRKQLVLASRVKQCKLLNDMLLEKGIKSVLLVGNVSQKQREEILSQKKDWEVIVATVSLAKEGLDVTNLDTLHLVSCLGNQSDTVQSVGRIERVCPGKKEPIVFDYVDEKIPYLVSKYKKRVNWLKRR